MWWLHPKSPGGVGENWEEDWVLGGVLKFREVTHWLKYFLFIIYCDKVLWRSSNLWVLQNSSSWCSRERTDLPVWWSEWYPLPEKTEQFPEEQLLQMFAQAIPMVIVWSDDHILLKCWFEFTWPCLKTSSQASKLWELKSVSFSLTILNYHHS